MGTKAKPPVFAWPTALLFLVALAVRFALKLLSKDEARRIAVNIAKMPER